MPRIAHIKDPVSAQDFGGKAAGLHALHEAGLTVPECIFVEATTDPSTLSDEPFAQKLAQELEPLRLGSRYRVAIRSSSTLEDAFDSSNAGRYTSVMGSFTLTEAIAHMKGIVEDFLAKESGSDAGMGLVVQRLVDPDYSGVAFSSDPITYSRRSIALSYIAGRGDKLVAGASAGCDLLVSYKDGMATHIPDCDLENSAIETICHAVKALEESLGYPVDVEWALVESEVRYLQCRPLAAITNVPTRMYHVAKGELQELPYAIRNHDKIAIRIRAETEGIPISNAMLYVSNCCKAAETASCACGFSPDCHSVSAVLTYPGVLEGKVHRSFVGIGNDSAYNMEGATVLSSSGYSSIDKCLAEYLKLAHRDYWICAVIVQEVFDPKYTGVVKADGSSFIIELIQGHFYTKGIVPPSRYIVEDGKVVSRMNHPQDIEYRIEADSVYERPCSDRADPSDEMLLDICNTFSGILSDGATAEFGVLDDERGNAKPYLIDFVDESAALPPSQLYREQGVISDGKGLGVLACVSSPGEASLDSHFHDSIGNPEHRTGQGEKIVIFAEKPDIALARLLEPGGAEIAAAVFESGSLLCHLAVVLRERGIPAVVVGDHSELRELEGSLVAVDAHTHGISGHDRVHAVTVQSADFAKPDSLPGCDIDA